MFTQEPMFTQDDGLVELVVLPTKWGAIAVDASWYDRHVIRNADWRVPWKQLLQRAESVASSAGVVQVPCGDIEPFEGWL